MMAVELVEKDCRRVRRWTGCAKTFAGKIQETESASVEARHSSRSSSRRWRLLLSLENGKRGMGNGKQGIGNGERGTWNGEQ